MTLILRDWAELFMHRSMREFIKFIHETGLSMTQLNTLMRLYYHGGRPVSEIAEFLGITNAAASQMAQRLVEQGLLLRTEDTDDRRIKLLRLSEAGRRLIEQGIEARRRWLEELTQALSPDQRQTIIAALTYLSAAARQLEPAPPHCYFNHQQQEIHHLDSRIEQITDEI
jgi:DNA-binding MarR family transcriptional regulator